MVVEERPGDAKMSEVLKDFIAPFRGIANTEEALHKLLLTATIAWNATLFPAMERMARLEKVLEAIPEEVREYGKAIISELKEKLLKVNYHTRNWN